MTAKIIENFENHHRALWGHHTVRLRHNLSQSQMFSDEGIAELIDSLPQERIAINTMAPDEHRLESWGYCDRAGQSGSKILDMVKAGRLWINMTRLDTVDHRFRRLLEQMFDEFNGYMPDFKTFKHSIGLLVSSPKAQVFYHADVPGQALWQIRGHKRVYIYPASEPFLSPREIENVIRGVTEEEVSYQPWYDDHAEIYDLEAGDMLHWGLNGPHRVMNLGTVNVSLTTEHWTRDIRRSYAMNYGNGVLRSLGIQPKSRDIHGAAFWAKVGLTAGWRLSGLHRQSSFTRRFKYRIDPASDNGLIPVESV
ncbi:MAG: hypothetical protein KDK89_01965 [Alphaproteobacteria bacterium]|nr:hypothetical protein [Alphaproteobacteria bacterium]